MSEARRIRQEKVGEWAESAFGQAQALSLKQRGLRLFEEAAEVAQAVEITPSALHRLIDYVYDREPGALAQELGGVSVCILAMAHAASLDAEQAETAELERILGKPIEYFRERNDAKNRAGFLAEECRGR